MRTAEWDDEERHATWGVRFSGQPERTLVLAVASGSPDTRPRRWHDRDVTDPRWALLQAARSELIAEFGQEGVDHVEYVAALPSPEVWVWLGTATDTQRDDLAGTTDLLARVQKVFAQAGVVGVQVTGVTTQSAETVQREYEGSWFYALR